MNTSPSPANGVANGRGRRGLRRVHRWAGATLLFFLALLSLTGIALNHATDLALDQRHVSWPWLLELYGIEAREQFAGRVRVDALQAVADNDTVYLLTTSGALVESIDLAPMIDAPIRRIGQRDNRVVVESESALLVSDAELMSFERSPTGDRAGVEWSPPVDASLPELQALQLQWRGPGLSVERILLDLHSGRLFGMAGKILLDVVAIGLLLLGFSGLLLMQKRNRRGQ